MKICQLCYLMALSFIATSIYAKTNQFYSPNKKLKIESICHTKNKCSYYSVINKKKKLIIDDISPDRVSITWLDNTVHLRVSLGTYVSSSHFIDGYHTPQIIDDVFALDAKSQCVVSADDAGIYFYKLFDKKNPKKVISASDKHYHFMEVATLLSIVEGKFSGNQFTLTYMDNNENEVSKVLDNPCQ
ncbi:MAG: hypothetical protein Q4A74_04980 [Cardiobacteriaceae bacterium]|nr:hypothetical protein [Cardiobacteriaceae bacterium]